MAILEAVMIAPRKQKRSYPMNNLLKKIKAWFKPKKPTKTKQLAYQPINHQHYAKLIKKLTQQMSQNERKRRAKC